MRNSNEVRAEAKSFINRVTYNLGAAAIAIAFSTSEAAAAAYNIAHHHSAVGEVFGSVACGGIAAGALTIAAIQGFRAASLEGAVAVAEMQQMPEGPPPPRVS